MCKDASITNIQYSYFQLYGTPTTVTCTYALGFLDLVQNSPFTLSPFEDDPKKNKMISALTVLREMN